MENKQKIKSFILYIAAFSFLSSLIFYAGFIMSPENFPARRTILISQNSTLSEAADSLKKDNVIRSSLFFKLWVTLTGNSKNVKAGDYVFEKPLSVFGVAKKIISGVNEGDIFKITVPEGWNLRDIGFLLENLGLYRVEEFWETTGLPGVEYKSDSQTSQSRDFSYVSELVKEKPASVSFEGYLFPDTYFFRGGISPEEVVNRMLANLNEKIDDSLKKRVKESGRTFFEILTMASILEKEAFDDGERRLIADILWRRLETGMALQVDATLTYITGKSSFELTKDDLALDSPYNTYRFSGLPLGPIANPGLDAIKAALSPEKNPYWYYLSDKNGITYFAKTFEEHKENRARYLSR